MAYDPRKNTDRRFLATRIIQTLLGADFYEEWHGDRGDITKERTFTRAVNDSIRIVVYTGVVGEDEDAECREVGKDAIRVIALYHSPRDEKDRGIVKETRVHRTGEIEAVVDRMLERMRLVWKKSLRPTRCHCGAPKFIAKSGNEVCADLCWKSDADLNETYRPQRRQRHGYYGRRYR
jgi:hypothetical protein